MPRDISSWRANTRWNSSAWPRGPASSGPGISCTKNIACSIMMSFQNRLSAMEKPSGSFVCATYVGFSRGLNCVPGAAPMAAAVGWTWSGL
jgi:hypothetical protein